VNVVYGLPKEYAEFTKLTDFELPRENGTVLIACPLSDSVPLDGSVRIVYVSISAGTFASVAASVTVTGVSSLVLTLYD